MHIIPPHALVTPGSHFPSVYESSAYLPPNVRDVEALTPAADAGGSARQVRTSSHQDTSEAFRSLAPLAISPIAKTMRIKGKVRELCSSCVKVRVQVRCAPISQSKRPGRHRMAEPQCSQVTRDMGYQEIRCSKDPRHAQRTKWSVWPIHTSAMQECMAPWHCVALGALAQDARVYRRPAEPCLPT